MRIAEINMMHIGSTGKIMFGIAESGRLSGHEVYTFSPYYYSRAKTIYTEGIDYHSYFGYVKENQMHYILGELTGFQGCWSWLGTKQLISGLKRIKPDIVHLHNLHNFSIDIPALFSYLRNEQIHTVWTLHDCWAVTGKCPHFSMVSCEKWKTGCCRCPSLSDYPKAYTDQVRHMWKLKRKWFSGISNMTIVTPCKWLESIVKESFLSEYPTCVINNGIDPDVFRPVAGDVRDRFGIAPQKHIVLGVAFSWDQKKGIDVFVRLAELLPKEYQIVLVGTNEATDRLLPENIISIHRTQNQHELAELYSTADVFVNPTREDTFPTVNLEALACGTPVITFNTGGSPETIDATCGRVVDCDHTDQTLREIINICENHIISEQDCLKKAQSYQAKEKFAEYIRLYEKMQGAAQQQGVKDH